MAVQAAGDRRGDGGPGELRGAHAKYAFEIKQNDGGVWASAAFLESALPVQDGARPRERAEAR